MKNQFKLTKPCANCPFRNDESAIHLEPGRREEIIEGLLSGQDMTFHCHKTVYREDGRNFDEEGNYHPKDICQCPGAAAVARKYGRDTVMVQVAMRMGVIPENHYDSALDLTIDKDQLNVDPQKAKI